MRRGGRKKRRRFPKVGDRVCDGQGHGWATVVRIVEVVTRGAPKRVSAYVVYDLDPKGREKGPLWDDRLHYPGEAIPFGKGTCTDPRAA